MTFDVVWAPAARKDLAALPPQVQRRVVAKVLRARVEPRRYFKRLRGDPASSLRVGEYRVLADVDTAGKRIAVLAIGHRKNVYGA